MQLAQEVADEVREASAARSKSAPASGRGRGSPSVPSFVISSVFRTSIRSKRNSRSIASSPRSLKRFPTSSRLARDITPNTSSCGCMSITAGNMPPWFALFRPIACADAVRDVGKALGLPTAEVDRSAKLSERGSVALLRESMEALPEFKYRVDAPLWRELVELAGEIAGFPPHLPTRRRYDHLVSAVGRMRSHRKSPMPGRIVCQWDKESVRGRRVYQS